MAKKRVGKAAARLYVEMGIWRLTEQNRSIESIERKIASSIAVWGVLVVLFLSVLAFSDSIIATDPNDRSSTTRCLEWILISAIAVAFVAAAGCAALGYRAREWKMGPALAILRQNIERIGEREVLMRIGKSLEESQEINESNIDKKGHWCNWSLYLSFCALVLIVIFSLAFRTPW